MGGLNSTHAQKYGITYDGGPTSFETAVKYALAEILKVKQETIVTSWKAAPWKPKPILPTEPTDRRAASRQLLGSDSGSSSGRRAGRRGDGTYIWVTVGLTADDLVV